VSRYDREEKVYICAVLEAAVHGLDPSISIVCVVSVENLNLKMWINFAVPFRQNRPILN
jgi:hypothetical protein